LSEIRYKTNDNALDAMIFVNFARQFWPEECNVEYVKEAIAKTINTTAWDGKKLVGCVRVLTDGYFFGFVTEILVLPNYQNRGIGKKLMELAFETSPTSLFFGARPHAEGFYEKLGYEKSIQSYSKKKPRRQ